MTIESISNAASSPPHLTFIGAGHLAQAMAAGILASGEGFQPPIALTARRTSHAKALQERFPDALVMLDNQAPELWCSSRLHGSSSHILFICTRPADVPTAITQLLPVLAGCPVDRRPTIVTMCPGIRLSQLESWLPADTAIVRSMPNTPLEVGAGSTALSANVAAAHSVADVEAVFRTVCPAVCLVEEDMLDVVAAVSGYVLRPPTFWFPWLSPSSVLVRLSKTIANRLHVITAPLLLTFTTSLKPSPRQPSRTVSRRIRPKPSSRSPVLGQGF